MKTIILAVLLFGAHACAANLVVFWLPSTDEGAAYRIHFGPAPGVYDSVREVGYGYTVIPVAAGTPKKVMFKIDGLTAGVKYYGVVRAYFPAVDEADTTSAESAPSNELPFMGVPEPPADFRTIEVSVLQADSLNGPKKKLATIFVETNKPQGFYWAAAKPATNKK